jgi:3-deoxy-D-manno-octulosonic-acid transferase
MIGWLVTPGLYRAASALARPAIDLYLVGRRARGKEDPVRFEERLGHAGLARPAGVLLWAHAASVGESLTLLPLIAALSREWPDLRVLVTSGTVTSATLLAERLPAPAFHQYVPIDRLGPVRRFLAHWRPDMALWVESELWPNLVLETAARGVPMLLVNARMSDASAARWAGYPNLIRPLLAAFCRVLAQTESDAARYRALGATMVEVTGNLKYDAPPLAHDQVALFNLGMEIGERPIWLAASTHDGEEAIVLDAHRRLVGRWPRLLTVIAPRHPTRGDEIARLVETAGLAVAQRSRGQPIAPDTAVYLADTLGELGLFYALARVVFVGGSLTPVGGHNALEPARLGCALIAGPDMTNFADLQAALRAANALVTVNDAAALAEAVSMLLADPALRAARAASAQMIAASLGGALGRTLAQLLPLVPRSNDADARIHARA